MQARSSISRLALSGDDTACNGTLRTGSRTFFAASLVLPSRIRRPASSLYAFCRMADDAVDQSVEPPAALQCLYQRLELIYSGAPAAVPADRAFADCVRAHSIPKHVPLALLEGFSWDAEGRRYETFEELIGYAVRVAGTVGVMMAMIMGVRQGDALARACDLGVAMQLTNIARDVGEDARSGRVYLPLAWLREAGIEVNDFLANPRFSAPLAGVIERLLKAADALYSRSEAGIRCLPASCRPAMFAARLMYAEIGHELRRRGLDSVNARAIVPGTRKAQTLAAAVWACCRGMAVTQDHASLTEADFLLQLLANERAALDRGAGPSRGLEGRVVWVIDLFERLQRADQSHGALH